MIEHSLLHNWTCLENLNRVMTVICVSIMHSKSNPRYIQKKVLLSSDLTFTRAIFAVKLLLKLASHINQMGSIRPKEHMA